MKTFKQILAVALSLGIGIGIGLGLPVAKAAVAPVVIQAGSVSAIDGFGFFSNAADTSKQFGFSLGLMPTATQILPLISGGATSPAVQASSTAATKLQLDDHLRFIAVTAAPTVTAACGTSPVVTGSDQAFKLNVGTGGAATTCTLTFNKAWAAAPVCNFAYETTTGLTVPTLAPTTTTIVITTSAAWAASTIIDVQCFGNS